MISQHTFDFLTRLDQNNSTEWVNAHRDELTETKNDVIAFTAILVEEISKFDPAIRLKPPQAKKCVTRLNRDMRLARGRGPYKKDFYLVVGTEGIQDVAASYCVHIEAGNCFVGGGTPNPKGVDLLNYRRKVADNFDEFTEIVTSRSFTELFPSGIVSQSGIVKKRIPAGFDASDPAADYLKKEGFITRERLADEDLMTEKGFQKIVELLKGSMPLVTFLNEK